MPAGSALGPENGVPVLRARRQDHTARIASALALLAGLVNLLSAALPAEPGRLRLVEELVPGTLTRSATVATAAAGVGLLLLSGALRRRERLAALAAFALLAGGAVLHLVKGLDVEEAVLDAFLAGLLLGRIDRFRAPIRRRRRALLRPAVVVVLVTVAYGLVGLALNGRHVLGSPGPLRLLVEVLRMAVGLPPSLPLTGRFAGIFPSSLAVVCYTGLLFVAARALAPAARASSLDPHLRAAVADSDDSLAYFALRDDRLNVRVDQGVVSYGVRGGPLRQATRSVRRTSGHEPSRPSSSRRRPRPGSRP